MTLALTLLVAGGCKDTERAPAEPPGVPEQPLGPEAVPRSVVGYSDEEAIMAIIESRIDSLQRCYEVALEARPELAGKITYTVGLQPAGRVLDVTIDDDTVGDANVAACTKAKIKAWRFPRLEDSGEVAFSVVFAAT